MKVVYVLALLLFTACAQGGGGSPRPPVQSKGEVFAEDVTFACEIAGSADDGFVIYATNSGSSDKKCSAGCTVTRNDGSTKSWSYTGRIVKAGPYKRLLGGETAVAGAPLREPKISSSSCD